MNELPIRSPAAKIGGIVYFGRMLDKIKANAKGLLSEDYTENLGRGFDQRCVAFLQIDYPQLVEQVTTKGGSDDDLLSWSFARGRKPAEDEIHVWNEFMRKCGWNDDITETVARRKKENGLADRSDIRTMFEFIDADEHRPLPDSRASEKKT